MTASRRRRRVLAIGGRITFRGRWLAGADRSRGRTGLVADACKLQASRKQPDRATRRMPASPQDTAPRRAIPLSGIDLWILMSKVERAGTPIPAVRSDHNVKLFVVGARGSSSKSVGRRG